MDRDTRALDRTQIARAYHRSAFKPRVWWVLVFHAFHLEAWRGHNFKLVFFADRIPRLNMVGQVGHHSGVRFGDLPVIAVTNRTGAHWQLLVHRAPIRR